jgi:exosortase/archaeosortase family protein
MADLRMTLGAAPALVRARWQDLDASTRLVVQLALVIGGTLVAFHYSLETLVAQLDNATPLAYVGLVPLIALALAAARARPGPHDPAIHDRQVDYIVGVPLVGAAAIIILVLPSQLSTNFWQWRIDLFALPLFVAGMVALVFGTRTLWRQRMPIVYLLLASPLPYTVALNSVLARYTNLTLAALRGLLRWIPVARPVPSPGDAIFSISHHGAPFALSVVTACSGVDGLVGFLLVGIAFASVVTGPLSRKGLWLGIGMVLLWAINLGRILFIFWAGRQWGQVVAIDVLHPFIGLVTFNAGVLLMVMVLGPFGLRIGGGTSANRTVARTSTRARALAIPSISGVALLALLASGAVGVGDTRLRSFDPVLDATGTPKMASFLGHPVDPAGWTDSYVTNFVNGRPEFGLSSYWYRWIYQPTGATTDLHANLPITMDVINAASLSGFDAYTVQDCYNFHGWNERATVNEHLGGGIIGQALSYDSKEFGDWSVLYWIVPVKGALGTATGTRYERIQLFIQDDGGHTVTDPLTGVQEHASTTLTERLAINRDFLTRFAREIIATKTASGQAVTLAAAAT